ncbi:MAG: purine-binding chemotaxis protein CheW [Candidatus Hydrogenedentes bacterium]|nr:purine-binding chemotaxis protein CheW [Candidatus Hydrogenedentota bacterium]
MEGAPAADKAAAILLERAAALSREEEPVPEAREYLEIVEFTMAQEVYGVPAAAVREVYPLREFTPLPGTPRFVLGIVNVRGQVLSLIDLKQFFGLPDRGLAELNRIVVLRSPRMEFGILADTILGVRRLPLCSLQDDPVTLTGIRKKYLLGVSKDGPIVLNAESILDDPELVVRMG